MSVILPRLVGADVASYLDRLVAALEDAILDPGKLAGAVIVGPVAIATTDTRIYHGLGQRPIGYWLIKAPSDLRVFDGTVAEATDPRNFVTLRLNAAATVTLVVI
jgi:hypothetical protein